MNTIPWWGWILIGAFGTLLLILIVLFIVWVIFAYRMWNES